MIAATVTLGFQRWLMTRDPKVIRDAPRGLCKLCGFDPPRAVSPAGPTPAAAPVST